MPLPTLKQVKSITLAVLSGRDKKLQAERDAVCNKCEHLHKFVTRNRFTGKLTVDAYCGKCGCGTRPMAGLRRNKHAYRALSCPLSLWPGDEKERGGMSIHDMSKLVNAYDRVEMQLATIQMHLDDAKPLTDQQFNELSGNELRNLRVAQGGNGVTTGIHGGQPNPKAVAAAAAARARQAALVKARPGVTLPAGEPSKDQIPDRLVKQHFRKAGVEQQTAQVKQ